MKTIFYWVLYPLIRPFYLIFLVFNTFVLAIIILLISPFDPKGISVHYIGKFWSRLNMFLAGVRVLTKGFEKIQNNQAYVLMSNHQSLFDVWAVLGYLPLQIRWIVKAEIQKMPVFGYALKRMGHIYVDRGKKGYLADVTEMAIERISGGASIFFFAEGTRSRGGHLQPFRNGGALIAIESRTSILPITINGSRFVLPKHTLQLMPGKIQIVVGDKIDVQEYTIEDKEVITNLVKDSIEQNLDLTYGSIP